jgi:hypothetical protein
MSLSTLYKSVNHEYYQTWLALSKPGRLDNETTGYLKVSCYLISSNDKPPVHGFGEKVVNNEILMTNTKKIAGEGGDLLKVVEDPSLSSKGYVLNVNIVRAEDLPKLGLYRCDSFLSVRVGNTILRTQTIEKNQKPKFSTRMVFPVHFPIMNDKVVMKLWDQKLLGDIFIANVPENPFEDLSFDLNYLQSAGGTIPFKWVNLYGIPKEERQVTLTRQQWES